ncbi:class I SAM-dependent methyltransferase [Paenibacillus sp. IB182496]|uniref:Class I SAM-dependent methyltransferase n=1 Tax=Paenibacillus sabuli TaxID=2772509 RepID=A0A927BT10_9BACL|nr:class I SAM-dependent methyltransferase [Paenibacillus sabuli]MBD2845361.1 class I SAM-dependent methyltransferase [Paenibacillus sabuli]
MKQNQYDDASFFKAYSQMPRSVQGLEGAGEWPVLRGMLPELAGKRVLDLGCGFGWHSRYAAEQGAARVLGLDLSERMLERARAECDDSRIEYRLGAIEDIGAIEDLDGGEAAFDVVLSSLALHYVEDYGAVCARVQRCLAPGGRFVLSVEHPIFTARAAQDWHYGPQGERLHWPVDEYQTQGSRETSFLGSHVVKYHRTVAAYMNLLLQAGFAVREVAEPAPAAHLMDVPGMRDELRRPMFLIIAADRV